MSRVAWWSIASLLGAGWLLLLTFLAVAAIGLWVTHQVGYGLIFAAYAVIILAIVLPPSLMLRELGRFDG